MYRVELHLSESDTIRLDEFRFFDPTLDDPLITANGGSPAYCVGASKNLFTWTVGVRAVTLLLVKSAIGNRYSSCISGELRSLAASLDYALSKEPAWMLDFFGISGSGHSTARRLFGRRNSERKRPGPVEVYLNDGLLNSKDILVFLNGQLAGPTTLTRIASLLENDRQSVARPVNLVTPTVNPKSPDEEAMLAEFPLHVSERVLRQFFDLRIGRLQSSLYSKYRNTSNAAVQYSHYNLHPNLSVSTRNVCVTSPGDLHCRWRTVIGTNGKERLLVTFDSPLAPGKERVEQVSFEISEFALVEDVLEHTVRPPTDLLTLEFACSSSHKITGASVFAEGEDRILFASLPKLRHGKTKDGHPCVRWTMKNPPQGFRFRLMWGIEARAEKHVESPLDSAIPATLN